MQCLFTFFSHIFLLSSFWLISKYKLLYKYIIFFKYVYNIILFYLFYFFYFFYHFYFNWIFVFLFTSLCVYFIFYSLLFFSSSINIKCDVKFRNIRFTKRCIHAKAGNSSRTFSAYRLHFHSFLPLLFFILFSFSISMTERGEKWYIFVYVCICGTDIHFHTHSCCI